MKKVFLFLIGFILSVQTLNAHELNFGLFNLFEKDQHYYMEIRLDRDNLIEAIGQTQSNNSDWNCVLSQYLNDRMSFVINGNEVEIEFQDFSYEKEVIVLMTQLNAPFEEVQEIEVENRVLLETIANQMNIIKVSFHDKMRSFRLSNERVATTIKY